jgi:hypothetical protein
MMTKDEQRQKWDTFVLKIFDAWWANHGDAVLRTSDLAPDVLRRMFTPSRQYAARFVARYVGRRVGNYCLENTQVAETQSKSHNWCRSAAKYRLTRQSPQQLARVAWVA